MLAKQTKMSAISETGDWPPVSGDSPRSSSSLALIILSYTALVRHSDVSQVCPQDEFKEIESRE